LSPQERLERLWAQEDKLAERLRAVRNKAHPLAAEVSRSMGFIMPLPRPALQRELAKKK
jgi:hypothetical protein